MSVQRRYVPAPMAFNRLNRQPLDKFETFNSINALMDYVKSGSAYPGQICKVKMVTANYYLEYIILGTVDSLYISPYNTYIDTKFYTKSDMDKIFDVSDDMMESHADKYTKKMFDLNTSDTDSKWILVHNYSPNERTLKGYRFEHFVDSRYYNYFSDLDLYKYNDSKYTFVVLYTDSSNNHGAFMWSQKNHPLTGKVESDETTYIKKVNGSDHMMELYKDGSRVMKFQPTGPVGESNTALYNFITIFVKANSYVENSGYSKMGLD